MQVRKIRGEVKQFIKFVCYKSIQKDIHRNQVLWLNNVIKA